MKTNEPVFELFLNYACTAKCPFCYNPPITPELLRRDLSFEQAAEALYRGARSGARLLNLHGGEVTLRDDLPKILGLARKLRFAQITIVTNGIRLADDAYLESLIQSGATHFRLSVHAPDAATHDRITAVPGSFDKVLAAITAIQRRRLPLGLNFVLIKSNVAALPDFVKRFMLQGGVEDVIVYFPHRRGLMAINEAAEGVSYADVAAAVREAAALAKSGLLLANFVPCAIAELSELMLDWGSEGAVAAMVHPEGKTSDLIEMKHEQRVPVAACGRCALGAKCYGVEREYLAARGEDEFLPLTEARA